MEDNYIKRLWKADVIDTGDHDADMVAYAAECLARIGYDHVVEAPYPNVLLCDDGGVEVTVLVLPLPPEAFELTLGDLEDAIDGRPDLREAGVEMCVGLHSPDDGGSLAPMRFEVVSACLNERRTRLRVHHVRDVWSSADCAGLAY